MRDRLALVFSVLVVGAAFGSAAPAVTLPDRYFELLAAEVPELEQRFVREGARDLETLEARPRWRHAPAAVLIAAVLYVKEHPANHHYRDRRLLDLALRVGDLLVSESEKGAYTARQDHHRDTYMWLDAYRVLERELDAGRRARWRRELEKHIEALAARTAETADRPAYHSPFIGTSPNHFALWSSTVYLGGRVFGRPDWQALGARALHRLAAEEQAPDGYWGEHSKAAPTAGYDYLTFAGVALYWEHSRDAAALEALQRGTIFHMNFTYPNGHPVELVDDRRRHVYVSPWGHFGFSHFPEGRRYAEFLTAFYRERDLSLEHLGRVAQDALYYEAGPTQPIPLDRTRYVHRLRVPAGIRKSGPWVVGLAGLVSTQAVTGRYYLDVQASLSIFHERIGLIVSGGHSKRQPELATFREQIDGRVFHLPLDSRLTMTDERDRLALAYNSFFSVLDVAPPQDRNVDVRFRISPRGQAESATLTLQLCLKPGLSLETGTGRRIIVGADAIVLGPEDLGGSIRHNGWTLTTSDRAARLTWPVAPYSPYAAGPDPELEHAVAALAVPLRRRGREAPAAVGDYDIAFTLQAEK